MSIAPIRVLWYFIPATHRCIREAIPRMCSSLGCHLEQTSDMNRVRRDDYDLLVSPATYIDPAILPGRVKAIIGPQLYVFPEGPTVGPRDPVFDKRYVITCLSDWVGDVWRSEKQLRFPALPLPTGVDTNRFMPGNAERNSCILYLKHRAPEDMRAAQLATARLPLPIITFVYGSYKEEDYITALKKARFMVVVDGHESQGYALQEAMSSGVPLVVWDVTTMYQEYGKHGYVYRRNGLPLTATSIPWWSDECGIRFTNKEELGAALDRMMVEWSTFKPRDYVVRNLSDEACMRRWLNAVGLVETS
jgi:hypothetical protein